MSEPSNILPPNVIRSAHHGCFKICNSPAWGTYLVPFKDPDGRELSRAEIVGIRVIKEFPKVPANLWARIITLFFYYCREGKKKKKREELEASIVFLRKEDDLSQWKVIVPQQLVTGGSVKAAFEKSCDIETGEEYEEFPPPGWIHTGSAHSHNTMQAFFSHTDDESELGVPGLHIVVGQIDKKKMTYHHRASIVLQRQRKEVEIKEVVDITPRSLPFHPNVKNYIMEEKDKDDEKNLLPEFRKGLFKDDDELPDDMSEELMKFLKDM